MAGLIDLACTNNVSGVIVGNEYYLRHRSASSLQYLHDRIQEVKSGILTKCGKTVPVTTAEIDDLIFNGQIRQLIDDHIMRPLWMPRCDGTYLSFLEREIHRRGGSICCQRSIKARELLETIPGQNKWVMIGETGWPSAGLANGVAVPSEFNQRKYLLELLPLVDSTSGNPLYLLPR